MFFGWVTDLKMEDEVKITVIATGFHSEDTYVPRDEQITQLNSFNILDEVELDIPPFLRSQSNGRR